MYKSYYFLNRLVLELRTIIIGKKILSFFSQEKDCLILQLDNLSIEFSVNHSQPYLNVRNNFVRAKKNTLSFFEHIYNQTICNVLIATDDRIIKITTDDSEIYFAIRGKYTNVFALCDNEIKSFTNLDEDYLLSFKTEVKSKTFICDFNFINSNSLKEKSISEIRKTFPFVGREIESEVTLRNNNNDNNYDILQKVLVLLSEDKPALFSNNNDEIIIAFDSLKIYSSFKKELFDNFIQAFNKFLSKKYYTDEKLSKIKKINFFLEREMKKLSSRLNSLIGVIEKGSLENEYSKYGNLLLINLNNIMLGSEKVQLDDIYSEGNFVDIKLESGLSVQKNAIKYFEKAKDSKINFIKSQQLYKKSKSEFEKLKLYQTRLEKTESIEEITQIMKELKIKDQSIEITKEDITSKFKHYIIDNKYHVFVGKDSQNNDLLTTKFAKQNDFWFHARSVSGSHVVLRTDNTKEAVPKSVLKKAASLAAFHSKAKTASLAAVTLTLKKFVVKRKGMPIGQVSLLKEDVLLVKPEIPPNCEFLQV